MLLILKYIFIPFSLLYCAVTGVRNLLYDISFLKTNKNFLKADAGKSPFVISVGNLTTGGTGKTPFIISLAERLISKGYKIGIVSRGYKRSSRGLTLVCDGNSIKSDCAESGDELMMISKKLITEYPGKFFTVADGNRVRAVEFILNNFSADIVLLDDAFQHRKIHRDFDIVLVDSHQYYTDKFISSFCIPSGVLRERFGNLKRADLIILNNKFTDITKCFSTLNVISKNFFETLTKIAPETPVLEAEYVVRGLFGLNGKKIDEIPENSISFSGIASDDSFKDTLNLIGIKSTAHYSFNDHHEYTRKDFDNILKVNDNSLKNFPEITSGQVLKSSSHLRTFLITTEKDSVKLSLFSDLLSNHTIYYVGISLKTDWAEFDKIFGKILDNNVRKTVKMKN